MKIKQIILFNFRQFKNENKIVFSTDEDKKVTFVMAENTTGKTTLIEAFRFLFLGYTNYKDEIVNTYVKDNSKPGNNIDVKVAAEIEYKGLNYTIARTNNYKIKNNNAIGLVYSTLKIVYKDNDGCTKTISEANAKEFLAEMMPRELFDYFFFEGESIEELGKDLFARGKKQNAFAEAIKALLGITHLYRLKNDLQKTVKKFNDDLEDAMANDKENQERQSEINKNLEIIEKSELELKEKELELERLREEKDRVSNILLENANTKEKQNERNKLRKKLIELSEQIKRIKQRMFADFSKNGWYLFASKLQDIALNTLKSENGIDKGIPGLDASCIRHIIEHHKCICGAEIIEGTMAYEKLKEIENFIPPINIGTQIREFKNKFTDINKLRDSVFNAVKEGKTKYNELITEYEKIENQIEKLDDALKDAKDMTDYVKEQKDLEKDIERIISENGKTNERITNCKSIIAIKEKEKTTINSNDRVKFIEKCLYYNKRCFNAVENYIIKHENIMREELEKRINIVFKNVFNVGYNIKLLEDYSLEIELDVDRIGKGDMLSGAQDTIVAFAFIGAVIELSKKQIRNKHNNNEDDDFESNSEPYPLVLDAPSSTFDQKRIRDFCKFIPELAEQTIIFIKDTDGEYVEKELSTKIGKRYKLVKNNEWETSIEEK